MTRLLRRLTPWWLLHFINRHTHTCWAEMVMWKTYDHIEDMNWRPRPDCWGNPSTGYDYCGRWQTREEMKLP